jgi:hypothetical protein
MSVGNLKTSGQKGNNWTWQYKMLRTLGDLLNINIGVTRSVLITRISSSTSLGVDTYSFSVANTGSVNGTVEGTILKPGEVVNFDAGNNNYFAAGTIQIVGTGTDLLVTAVV